MPLIPALGLLAALAVFLVVAGAVFLVTYGWRMARRHPEMGWFYGGVQTLCLLFVRFFYRVRVQGVVNVPDTGGVLIVCNHVSYLDPVLIGTFSPRPVRFLSWDGFERMPVMRQVMRLMGTIPVDPSRAKDAVAKAGEALRRGEVVCIFPEGNVTRNGALLEIRRGFELIARRAGCPIVPAWVDGKWGSILSLSEGRLFWKKPRGWRRAVGVAYGKPFPAEAAGEARLRLLEVGSEVFATRPQLRSHLAAEVAKGLGLRAGREAVVDRTQGRRAVSGAVLLSLAWLLARRLRTLPEARVGVVLPAGLGATVANLACAFADKVPVNLNFTVGRAAAESCLRRAGIRTMITAEAFRSKLGERFPDFPWTEDRLDIAETLKALPRWKIALVAVVARVTPSDLLPWVLGLPREGGEREAGLLFTSGSSGEPKGVALSHANILANLFQIDESGAVPRRARLLSSLPVFHSFGFTVGVWYALSRDTTLITLPSPVDAAANIAAVREERATVTVGTPTFLRPWLRKAKPDDLATLEWAVAGAEKVPADLVESWARDLGTPLLEGYGTTEASPVLAVNIPDVTVGSDTWRGNRPGSVGRPVVGVALRFLDPDTGAELAAGATGLVQVRGANLFSGYLADPERTAEVLRDGWYATGDLGRLDEEGFLHLEGRLSRFSKVGGEMVPHGAVEDALLGLLGGAGEGAQPVAVAGRPDDAKGEQLVVLHAVDLDPDRIREGLVAAGLPNLWIPKVFVRVPAIPVLGTGKLDLRAIRQLAS
jgi:acyl-[acyl-carrier-protein]-phospholipid O-acyltransferase / long-chain-fatty-acid--[acyl-carrier-protein] ligase